nr:DNA polymerase III subunit delta' [uncultured Sphingomonas sp.]
MKGQERATGAFLKAWNSGRIHHAWLLTGPKGIGKALFARLAAIRVLAEASGPPVGGSDLETPAEHPTSRLVAAGSHPDFRWLERLERPSGGLARNISVDQVRTLADLFAVTPSMSPWRAIVIDSIDDLEASAANALLKMLEEPPAHTLFLLISHAPGRLLPTIRSRCRRLDLDKLDHDTMTSLLNAYFPTKNANEIAQIADFADGSIGKASAIATYNLASLEQDALTIMREGDPTNARRAKLASSLALKAESERYAAFLDIVPGLIAREAATLNGAARARALDAYDKARRTAVVAPRLSLDPGFTVFQLGSILASVAALKE